MATVPASGTNVDFMENESLFMACFDDILNVLDLCDEELATIIKDLLNR